MLQIVDQNDPDAIVCYVTRLLAILDRNKAARQKRAAARAMTKDEPFAAKAARLKVALDRASIVAVDAATAAQLIEEDQRARIDLNERVRSFADCVRSAERFARAAVTRLRAAVNTGDILQALQDASDHELSIHEICIQIHNELIAMKRAAHDAAVRGERLIAILQAPRPRAPARSYQTAQFKKRRRRA